MTRLDLGHPVGQWCRFMANPSNAHHNHVKRVVWYLIARPSICIKYRRSFTNVTDSAWGLHGYVDSDYSADLDSSRSTTGRIFYMAGAPISWHSKKQGVVAKSSTEAEYYAASEAVWIRNLMTELGEPLAGPVTIRCDNNGAKSLAEKPESRSKAKHIRTEDHRRLTCQTPAKARFRETCWTWTSRSATTPPPEEGRRRRRLRGAVVEGGCQGQRAAKEALWRL